MHQFCHGGRFVAYVTLVADCLAGLEYREQNREKLKIQTKEYKEKNKDKIDEINKKYRMENKDKFKERNMEIITCKCGCSITFGNKQRHEKTRKHLNLMESLSI